VDHYPAEAIAVGGIMSGKIENTVDATRGQPLAARVIARKNELEDALAELGPHDVRERQAIETALATVYLLMTGDLAHPSDVVAHNLNLWLERNKHLGQEITRRQNAVRLAQHTVTADEHIADERHEDEDAA
jgi:hypothetical protein